MYLFGAMKFILQTVKHPVDFTVNTGNWLALREAEAGP